MAISFREFASRPQAVTNDLLCAAGSAIKSLGGSRVGGHLVVWGNPELTDRSKMRDYFTKDGTDLGRWARAGTLDVYLHHGLPKIGDRDNPLAEVVLGEATVKPDEYGLAVTTELDGPGKAIDMLMGEIKAGRMGWSSGSTSHLVRRTARTNKAGETVHEITRWPIVEASLTPQPAELRARATLGGSQGLTPDDSVVAASLKHLRAWKEADDRRFLDGMLLAACRRTLADVNGGEVDPIAGEARRTLDRLGITLRR